MASKQELDSRLHCYQPARPEVYYNALSISLEGRLEPRVPLTARDRSLLEEAGADISLWDGTHGRDGLMHPHTRDAAPLPPAASDLAHVREMLHNLRDDSHSALRVRSPQADVNAALLSGVPHVATGGRVGARLNPSVRLSGPKSSASLLAEARTREAERDTRKWFTAFARPALLAHARAHAHVHAFESGGAGTAAAPAARMHAAARAWALTALRAFADACEAAQQLYAVETVLASALNDVRSCIGTRPQLSALENALRNATRDAFVPAVLRALERDPERWRIAVSSILPLLRKRRVAKALYDRLAQAYKLAGELYDAVQAWKAQLAPVVVDATRKEALTKEKLLDVWEKELVSSNIAALY